MKIISKTYLLIAVLIAVAVFNLFLLYEEGQASYSESYSIIKAGDLKVEAEKISGLATSVASGNLNDKQELQTELNNFQTIVEKLNTGEPINGQQIEPVPQFLLEDYSHVVDNWKEYKQAVLKVEKTSVFDQEATDSINYVLQKNSELVLLTNSMVEEIGKLDRDYNRHKDIAKELAEYAQEIGQVTLLMSIGEGENTQEELKEKRLKFEVGLRKLLQIPTQDMDVESAEHETLIAVPRENSESLRKLDPLWESIKLRIGILEERALLSPDYEEAKKLMNSKKLTLFEHIDHLLDGWNRKITEADSQTQIIIQVLLAVDIGIFITVMIILKKSLSPLETITNALSRVKEGIYGEEIQYNQDDEVGELVKTFNIMSNTIKQKEEETKQTDIAKDEFLAMITHELKTPLVPIQGYADILLGEHLGKLNAKQKERISIIKASSNTLLDLVSDLLDAQKLDLGQLRMKKQKKDIFETINTTIEAFRPQAQSENIKLTVDSPKIVISHDPERIMQVISNLIKNSIAVVSPNTGTIKVKVEDLDSKIRISVIDNGIGIPKEKQNQLFKKFYQVDASLTRKRGGSGLGLAICKGIVESHGGEISAQTDEDKGATFSFTLPKDQSEGSPIHQFG